MAIDDLLSQFDALRKRDAGPFPYEGCRWLQAAARERHDGLIPDLDVYLSEVAGYRSWGKKILKWSDEKIAAVEQRLGQSFFERFPNHAALQPLVTSPKASDVRRALHNVDQTREVLIQLLTAIRRTRVGP
jgi:hypothetical protein